MKKRLSIALLTALLAATAFGQVPAASAQPIPAEMQQRLLAPIDGFDSQGGALRDIFPAISRACGVPIVADPDVTGTVNFECSGLNLKQFLNAVCSGNGLYYYIHPDGYVMVRTRIARIYPVDFLAAERKTAGQSSFSMSSSSLSESGSGSSSGGRSASSGASASASGSGQNSVDVTSTNKASLWEELEAHGKAILKEKEVFQINRTSGVIYLDASLGTHANFETLWRRMMLRVNRGVDVKVEVFDVRLNNSKQLGVDWQSEDFRARGVYDNSVGGALHFGRSMTDSSGNVVKGITGTTSGITSVSSTRLAPSTFAGTIGIGKVTALVAALQTQGDVVRSSSPSVGVLNNRTGVIQVTDDMAFFEKNEDYSIDTSSGSSGSVTSGAKWNTLRFSFGLLMYITNQISDDGVITLDLETNLTDYVGTKKSEDAMRESPEGKTQRTNTQIQLRPGQGYVMGGYLRKLRGHEERDVPVLSKIPLLGAAFKNDAKVNERSELVIVVTATLRDVPPPKPIEVFTPDPSRSLNAEIVASGARDLPAATPASLMPASVLEGRRDDNLTIPSTAPKAKKVKKEKKAKAKKQDAPAQTPDVPADADASVTQSPTGSTMLSLE